MFFPLSALSVLPRDSCHLLIGRCTFRSLPLPPATQLEILLEFNRISKVLRKFRCFGEMQFSFLRFLLLCQLLPLVLFFFSFFFFLFFWACIHFLRGLCGRNIISFSLTWQQSWMHCGWQNIKQWHSSAFC